MARLLKQGKAFKPVKVTVTKDEPKAKATSYLIRGKFKKPPAKKQPKPPLAPAPDAGPFKGKF